MRSLIRGCAAASFYAMAVATFPAAALDVTAPGIKAAFLYKFGFYVEWPQAAFAASDSPIEVCIVGNDPFGPLLDDIVKGQKIGNRTIVVRRTSALSRDSGCHIAFLSDDASSHTEETLASLRGSDVLTVTDAKTDGGAGIINFVIKDDRVRFDIDDAAAASGGLVIGSRLLSIALDVKPRH